MLNSKRGDLVGDCPRCGEHSIVEPRALNALSRTTRGLEDIAVYVCSPCGRDEAMRDFAGLSHSDWPVPIKLERIM